MSDWRNQTEVLFDEHVIAARVAEMGAQITQDYNDKHLTAIGILKGSFVFFADLMRNIDLPLHCEFMGISSYGNDTQSSGVVKITSDLSAPVEGRDLLIIEDIIDTGLTIRYLLDNLRSRRPNSIKICTLLYKPERLQGEIDIDYLGFKIPDKFVVGYGLDMAGDFRNLPYIGVYHGG